MKWNLADMARDSNRKFSGRINNAFDNIGDSFVALL